MLIVNDCKLHNWELISIVIDNNNHDKIQDEKGGLEEDTEEKASHPSL